MKWTKELPKDPGYYWILDHDEDGSAIINIVEIVQMPQDKEIIEEFMECEDDADAEVLLGKLIVLTMGEAYVQILDDLSMEGLLWCGPLDHPETPAE